MIYMKKNGGNDHLYFWKKISMVGGEEEEEEEVTSSFLNVSLIGRVDIKVVTRVKILLVEILD